MHYSNAGWLSTRTLAGSVLNNRIHYTRSAACTRRSCLSFAGVRPRLAAPVAGASSRVLIKLDDMVINAVQCGCHRCVSETEARSSAACASLHSAGCVLNGTAVGPPSTPMYQRMSAIGTDHNSAERLPLDVHFDARSAPWHVRGGIHERAVRSRLLGPSPAVASTAANVSVLLIR
jgi:hypothetical protein